MGNRLENDEKYKSYKDVFDSTTGETLFRLAAKRKFSRLESPIKIGKESNIFSAIADIGGKKERVAIKIYRILECNFKRMSTYLSMDERFRSTSNRRSVVLTWAKREYRNLFKAYKAGVSVPKPLSLYNNVLIMEFIGEKDPEKQPEAAPLIKHYCENPKEMFEKTLKNIKLLYHKAKLVHGDLSEYNILNLNDSPILIDLSHATPVRDAQELFKKDIYNVCKFFNRFNLNLDADKIIKEIQNED